MNNNKDIEKFLAFFGFKISKTKPIEQLGYFLGGVFFLLLLISLGLILAYFVSFAFQAFSSSFFQGNNSENFRNFVWAISVLFGAPFVIWRIFIAAKQVKVAEQNHFTELYVKAVEQLGVNIETRIWDEKQKREVIKYEPNMAVRLGGLYALERLAKDSEKDFETIMSLLCAYVRKESWRDEEQKRIILEEKPKTYFLRDDPEQFTNWIKKIKPPNEDIIATIKIISNLNSLQQNNNKIELTEVNLAKIELENCDFSNINFSKSFFTKGIFRNINFSKSDLWFGNLEDVWFIKCDFTETVINTCLLEQSIFTDCDFKLCNIARCHFPELNANESFFENSIFLNKHNDFPDVSLDKLSKVFGMKHHENDPCHWPYKPFTDNQYEQLVKWREGNNNQILTRKDVVEILNLSEEEQQTHYKEIVIPRNTK